MKNVVLDANLIASLVLPLPYSDAASVKILTWKRDGVIFAAPSLWSYEVCTVVRKALVAGYLTPDQAYTALEQIWRLNIVDIHPTLEIQQQAIAWAGRLGQSKTYDSAYLTAAETIQAEFWTTDQRLARSAQQAGAAWVHMI